MQGSDLLSQRTLGAARGLELGLEGEYLPGNQRPSETIREAIRGRHTCGFLPLYCFAIAAAAAGATSPPPLLR